MLSIAECDCGFTGTDPRILFPDWQIIIRSDNGNIVSNNSIDGRDIVHGLINHLQWVPDVPSETNYNSKVLVGPVNKTHNQSSYQWLFGSNVETSSIVGTMTVVGKTTITILLVIQIRNGH